MALADVLRALADLAPGDREPEDTVDAFASRWDGDAAGAAVELATSFRPAAGHP